MSSPGFKTGIWSEISFFTSSCIVRCRGTQFSCSKTAQLFSRRVLRLVAGKTFNLQPHKRKIFKASALILMVRQNHQYAGAKVSKCAALPSFWTQTAVGSYALQICMLSWFPPIRIPLSHSHKHLLIGLLITLGVAQCSRPGTYLQLLSS